MSPVATGPVCRRGDTHEAGVCQCVKALVYYDVQTCHLDLRNDKGDSALHMASRWGYEGIIQALLENGADAHVSNRSGESPLHCALNPKVSPRSGSGALGCRFTTFPDT